MIDQEKYNVCTPSLKPQTTVCEGASVHWEVHQIKSDLYFDSYHSYHLLSWTAKKKKRKSPHGQGNVRVQS